MLSDDCVHIAGGREFGAIHVEHGVDGSFFSHVDESGEIVGLALLFPAAHELLENPHSGYVLQEEDSFGSSFVGIS